MQGYVSTHRLEELRDTLTAALHEVEELLKSPELVDRRRDTGPAPARERNGANPALIEPKYRIAPGQHSYADLVWEYMPAGKDFSLDDAVKVIRPMVIDPSERFRDGMRQGLKRDDRFREKRYDDGVYFRKVTRESDGSLGIEEGW